jgi:hypothetical protein
MNRLRTARGALSYANVMATVAVFLALGGIAGAAVKPLLDKQGVVKGRHVARGAIHMSDLAPAVRNRIAVEPLPAGNYAGQAADGTFSITALIDRDGTIVQMSADGNCAFAAQSGTFDANYPDWNFTGSGPENAFVLGFALNGSIVVRAVGVAGANPNTCFGPVELNPA